MRSPLGLVPLVGFLRESGAVPAAVPVAPLGALNGVLAAFKLDLVSGRAVSPATVRSYCSQVRPLVAVFAEGWEALTSERVREFIDDHVARDTPRAVQVRINAVRALLRWLWRERMIAEPLHEQVLSMYAPGGPPPPRGLSPAEVAALFASLSSDPAARVRDVALVTLMLRLGLRAGEAASLQLESLDWRDGTITVCAKGSRVDRVPIPHDVGAVLVAYLRDGRPSGTGHRAVFLAVDGAARPGPFVRGGQHGEPCDRSGRHRRRGRIAPTQAHRSDAGHRPWRGNGRGRPAAAALEHDGHHDLRPR